MLNCPGSTPETPPPPSPPSRNRIAAIPSVTSMPTGHHVMHRPQPTHPDVPNWSIHDANLCVSHWRYRPTCEARTTSPAAQLYSALKQVAHSRVRVASSPERVTSSTTSWQKHVGHALVPFPQARHRCATSFQRGCERLR